MKKFILRNILPPVINVVKLLLGSRNKVTTEASNWVFIIGSGRNGSTLLSSILNNSPDLFIPPEQYVIPFYAAKWQLLRFKKSNQIFNALVQEFSIPKRTVNWEMTESDYQPLKENSYHSFYAMVTTIFNTYAIKKGKHQVKILGEKSPLMIHYWKLFVNEFPKANYLFLLRDPRDVVYSFSQVPDHEANDFQFAIWKWKDALLQHQKMNSRGLNTLLVKYEELVADPSNELQKIHNYLGTHFDPSTLNQSKDSTLLGVNELVHHQNLVKPINTDSIGKWRGQLGEEQLTKIQKELGQLASAYGYDLYD